MKIKIYVHSLNFFRRLKIYINLLINSKLYFSPKFKNKNSITYTDTKEFTKIFDESRKIVNDHFEKIGIKSFNNDVNIFNYVKKYYDYKFTDFFIFINSLQFNKLHFKYKNILADNILKNIYFNIYKKSFIYYFLNIFLIFISFIKYNIYFFKAFLTCLLTKNIFKYKHPEILYLRKKNYIDYVYSTLNSYLNKDNIISQCVIISFSLNKIDKYPFLNNLESSTIISIKSYFYTLKDFIYNIKFFTKLGLNDAFTYDYLTSSYISFFISQINSKIITGVLIDKPIFSLIYKNKSSQKICSLNEAFMFKPFRYFDYCFLDTYFYMNEYDKKMINQNGGIIDEYIKIPFFRKNLNKINYEGLSLEFVKKLKNYKKKILFAPSVISKINYRPTSQSMVEQTLLMLEKYINFNNDTLIIIKEKKGELKFIGDKYKDLISNNENFYIINSDKPKNLIFNQFEEIVPEVDLLITLTSTSTTILQSLDMNVPFICVNNDHPLSFYKKYDNCEVHLSNLLNTIKYWISLKSYDRIKLTDIIKSDLNIKDENGLIEISKYFKRVINE